MQYTVPSAIIVVQYTVPSPIIVVSVSVEIPLPPPNTTNSTQSRDTTYADREWLCLSVTDVGNISYDERT